ncbi:KCTD1_15 [Mytilus coruscus]|uniref:KCTD1_15 n=1 Tax=Mytilus coruscus TaxID=42192 RepID=A0A6J8CUG0_MYTCO|nr:KCTD1_15 [Mytilus coruscus]
MDIPNLYYLKKINLLFLARRCRLFTSTTKIAGVDSASSEIVKKPRFSTVNDEKFQQSLREKDSMNTQKATTTSVRLLKKNFEGKDMPCDIKNYPVKELDSVSSTFYAKARNKNWEMYQTKILKNTRYGINRYLNEKREIGIFKDPDFIKSIQIYKMFKVCRSS